MFESDFLDLFSRVHPAVPVVIFLPTIAVLGWLALGGMSPLRAGGLALLGYGFWTLTEYWIHRGLFHWEPAGGLGARLHWMFHGVHHDHPNDRLRLVMPPSVSVPLVVLFFLAFRAALGAPSWYPFGAGFISGYLAYDMMHFHVHHHRPRTGIGRRLRTLHLRHHFEDSTRGYGISAPYWDHVFGTHAEAAKRKGSVVRSTPSVRAEQQPARQGKG